MIAARVSSARTRESRSSSWRAIYCNPGLLATVDVLSPVRDGYAPKGMMKAYVAIPIRLPTGELTGHIGITEAKLPKEFHLSNVVTFPKKIA